MTLAFTQLLAFALTQAVDPAAATAAFEDTARIREAAETVVLAAAGTEQRVEAEASVDDRLRLPACAAALAARLLGQNTVQVECQAPGGWHLYVPVRVRRYASVLVLARPVSPGEPLNADAAIVQEVEISRVNGATLGPTTALEGMSATRMLPAGTVLTQQMVKRIPRVRRGEMIALVASSGGLTVQASGMALADAATGDTVSVRNMASQRVVQGVVTASGQVAVTF